MAGKGVEKLSDLAIKNATSKENPYKLSDGAGLYIEVMPNAAKYWRLKFRYGGKEKRLALGVYPTVTLKSARKAARDACDTLAQGIDPTETRRRDKLARNLATANSFKEVALEWYEKEKPHWSDGHIERQIRLFDSNLFPWLGHRPIGEINPPELLAVLRRTESKGNGGGNEYRDGRKILETDLNGDASPDAIVLYTIEGAGGGNAAVHTLALFFENHGNYSAQDSTIVDGASEIALGDDGTVIVTSLMHGPDDPDCCPSMSSAIRYRIEGNQLLPL